MAIDQNSTEDVPAVEMSSDSSEKSPAAVEIEPSLSLKLNNEIDVDEALGINESFGRFQYIIQVLFTYLSISVGYHAVMMYFIADDPSWKCTHNNTNNFCEQNFGIDINKDNEQFSRRCQMNRDEWTFSKDKTYSIVTEYNLVCNKASIAALVSAIYHVGGACGVFMSGLAADRYGRKFVLLFTIIAACVFSISCSFTSNPLQLAVGRTLLGATSWSSYHVGFVYLGEFISPKYRPLAANIFGLGFSLSELVISAVAYYCKGWRDLQLYTSFPSLITVIFFFMLPESPRWQLVNSKKLNAESTLEMIGKFNGSPFPSLSLKSPTATAGGERKYTYCDLIRNRKVLCLTLSQALIWFTTAMSYYMISFESSNLGGSMYQAFAFSALAELPSNFFTTFALNRFGRKRTILICILITGVISGSTTLIPKTFSNRYIMKIVLLILAKCSAAIAFLGCFIWTFEVFPTALRLQGWGVCVVFERVGSFIAPFLTTVLQQFNSILPYIIVLILSLATAAVGLILPETKNRPTRERYEDFFDVDALPKKNCEENNSSNSCSQDVEDGDV